MGLDKAQAPRPPGPRQRADHISVIEKPPGTRDPGQPRRFGDAVIDARQGDRCDTAGAGQQMAVIGLKLASANTARDHAQLDAHHRRSRSAGTGQAQGSRRAGPSPLSLIRNGIDQKPNVPLSKPDPPHPRRETQLASCSISTPANVARAARDHRHARHPPDGRRRRHPHLPARERDRPSASSTVVDRSSARVRPSAASPAPSARGCPTTATGQALAGEIAIAVDDRTNTLVVAGREEAVALVES
jgi:hypothetical protein